MSEHQNRPETGVMRFGDDWPGVFIRGDNAVGYAVVLEKVLAQASRGEKLSFFDLSDLHELARQLHECDQGVGSNPQQLKSWDECVPSTCEIPSGALYASCAHRGRSDGGHALFTSPCALCVDRGE